MPTVIKPIDDDVRECLDGAIFTYLNGQCYELAIALHRGLDWSLIGLVQDLYGQSVIRHVAVRHPDGGYFDGRGRVDEDEFIRPMGEGRIITFDSETELKHRTRAILESRITMAGRLAMSRWPNLPWLPDTYFQKVIAFLDDLEKLCRHHGFWLYGNTATSWPMIVVGDDDDEIGYALATNSNGQYSTNRFLKVERDMEKHADRLRRLGLPDKVIEEVMLDPTIDADISTLATALAAEYRGEPSPDLVERIMEAIKGA